MPSGQPRPGQPRQQCPCQRAGLPHAL